MIETLNRLCYFLQHYVLFSSVELQAQLLVCKQTSRELKKPSWTYDSRDKPNQSDDFNTLNFNK